MAEYVVELAQCDWELEWLDYNFIIVSLFANDEKYI